MATAMWSHPGLTKDLPCRGASVSACLYICAHLCVYGGQAAAAQQHRNSVICFSPIFPHSPAVIPALPFLRPLKGGRGLWCWAELGLQRKLWGRNRGKSQQFTPHAGFNP